MGRPTSPPTMTYWRKLLVFPNQTGKPMHPWVLVGGSFKKLLTRAGLPTATRFHDLRHTCATLLLTKGVHPKIVQEMLGPLR